MQSYFLHYFFFMASIWFCLGHIACQPHSGTDLDLPKLKANLERTRNRRDYDALHFLLVEHYIDLSTTDRKTLRQMLEKHAIWPNATLCPKSESGTEISIQGRVVDDKGKPISGAKLHIFHTDHQGFYAPTDAKTGHMAEHDPRLEGFLITDEQGNYKINTIRPTSYPKKYNGRLIPQHIHIVASAPGVQLYSIQVVFEDDPVMDAYWLDWAKRSHYPVVKLLTSKSGIQGELNIQLIKD